MLGLPVIETQVTVRLVIAVLSNVICYADKARCCGNSRHTARSRAHVGSNDHEMHTR